MDSSKFSATLQFSCNEPQVLLKTLIRLQPPVDEELYSSDSGRRHFLTRGVFTKIPALFRTSTDLEVDKVVAAFSSVVV